LSIGNHRYRVSWDDAAPQPQASLLKRELAPVAQVVNPPDDDDELLESCDDPVALAEPVGQKLALPRLAKPLKPPPLVAPEPIILPDDISLAPAPESHSAH
jgi:hypothetical protein